MFERAEMYFPDELVVLNVGDSFRGNEVTGIAIDNEKPDYIIITTGNLHHRMKPIASKLVQSKDKSMRW